MTPRRRFVASLAALACAAAGEAVRGRSPPARVAVLVPAATRNEQAFRDALRERGYAEGENLAIERRSADGDFARLPALASELAATKPDVIVAFVTQASLAAKRATSTVPIVMVAVSDPVKSGIVADLAKPGGNVTGTAGLSSAVVGKLLGLAREVRPRAVDVALLWNPANAVYQEQSLQEAAVAGQRLGVRIRTVGASNAPELAQALRAFGTERPEVLAILGDPWFTTRASEIAAAALALRLPSFGGGRAYAEAGILASYAPDLAESSRRAAAYVDRILRGARPADLPVELVAKFELVLNARTAKALGLAFPPALRLRADEVIG